MVVGIQPLDRIAFPAQRLVEEFPPRLEDRNKQLVYGIACPPGAQHRGTLAVSRWGAMELPRTLSRDALRTVLEVRPDLFMYEPAPVNGSRFEWYLNFADENLFVGYGHSLFAQDEMQVAEHPALGSLREALLATGVSALTCEDDQPTPILIAGVERRCRIATEPNAAMGRPRGLYANHFVDAAPSAIAAATQRLDPPTVSHILAIQAIAGGFGLYKLHEIEHTLRTAYTGFRAALLESDRVPVGAPEVVVHTGYWGCGAYGGNRVLMALLQLLAAQLAGIDRLVFHAINAAGAGPYGTAAGLLSHLERPLNSPGGETGIEVEPLVQEIAAMAFRWGTSDGT